MLSKGTTPGGSRFLHHGHTERSLQDPIQAADPGHSFPGTDPAEIPQVQARKTLAIKAKKSCPCLMAPRCTPARCLLCCRAGSGQKSLPHTSQHHTLCSPNSATAPMPSSPPGRSRPSCGKTSLLSAPAWKSKFICCQQIKANVPSKLAPVIDARSRDGLLLLLISTRGLLSGS